MSFTLSSCSNDDRHLENRCGICAGDKWSQISRSVLNAWCNETVQDAARHVLELQTDVSALKKDKLTCQQTLSEQEEEWMEADSRLRLQCVGEKREMQRSCMEQELLLRMKLGAEREAVAADLAACRAVWQAMISAEECNYQKQVVLSKCEAERDSYAAKLDLQKELVDRSPVKNSLRGSCADSGTEQQTRVRWLEESLGNCRYDMILSAPIVNELSMAGLRFSKQRNEAVVSSSLHNFMLISNRFLLL